MKDNPYTGRQLHAGRIMSNLYLLIFGISQAYSAAATALDRNSGFPSWEPRLGWLLFALPCLLIASLYLLHARRSGLGFALLILNLCLYAAFLIFESMAYKGRPVSHQAVWEVSGIWAALFLLALLAAFYLKTKTQSISH